MTFVSVIIPSYQEKDFIGKCLDSLIENDYPKESLEILVLDGGSDDGTREIIKDYSKNHPFIKFLDNPKKFAVSAVNKGIRESKGEIVIRCDVHAEYCPDYISRLVSWLEKEKKIGSVGGIWINRPEEGGIPYALSHFFCVGPGRYRVGVKEPQEVDTVPFGAWRREVLDEVGFLDERFLRAEDLEFNIRIKRAGYKIVLDPEIKIYYYPRDSYGKLFSMMFQYGYWKNLVNRELKVLSSVRQLIPPLFVLYLGLLPFFMTPLTIIPLLVYLGLILIFSFNHKGAALAFLSSHIGYGLGYLKGFWDIIIMRKKSLTQEKITR